MLHIFLWQKQILSFNKYLILMYYRYHYIIAECIVQMHGKGSVTRRGRVLLWLIQNIYSISARGIEFNPPRPLDVYASRAVRVKPNILCQQWFMFYKSRCFLKTTQVSLVGERGYCWMVHYMCFAFYGVVKCCLPLLISEVQTLVRQEKPKSQKQLLS